MLLFLQNLWNLFVDMSFYLVIGILFTGVLHAFVKKSFILKHVGGNSFGSVVKASVVGVPLPLCSCGVVPLALYLRNNGASKGATVSFLTSTPQTGVDSIIATYGMLGGFFAVFRAIVAFVSGIIAGCVTNLFFKKDKKLNKISSTKESCSCGCEAEVKEPCSCGCEAEVKEPCGCGCEMEVKEPCSCGCETKVKEPCSCGCEMEVKEPCSCGCETKVKEPCSCGSHVNEKSHICSCGSLEQKSGCSCSSGITSDQPKKTFGQKIISIFTYSFGGFLDEISVNFVIGIVVASLITTLVPTELFTYFSNPLLQMLLMLILGIPMYVCSTASIPIAVALVIKGISPGSAFVFLFAGPVTNIASLTMLTKSLEKKLIAIYLSCVAVCSVAFGFLLDFIIEVTNYSGLSDIVTNLHGGHDSIYKLVVAVIFGVFILISLSKKIIKLLKN